jgi:hypothetical protein
MYMHALPLVPHEHTVLRQRCRRCSLLSPRTPWATTAAITRVFLGPGNVHSSLLERGFEIPGFPSRPYQCYEANMPFVLRYMIDRDITGCCWVEAPKNTYRIRLPSEHISSCQLEIDIVYDSLIAHPPDGTPRLARCLGVTA